MSRIAKSPVTLPKGVEATLAADALSIKGPLGTLSQRLRRDVKIEKDGDKLVFKALDDSDEANAMSGTLRALAANMVVGVTKGFEKRLTLVGAGYRAQAQGEKLNLALRSASGSPRRPRAWVSRLSLSTARDTATTAASRLWPTLPGKPVSSSRRKGGSPKESQWRECNRGCRAASSVRTA